MSRSSRTRRTIVVEACERQIYDGTRFLGTIAATDGRSNWRAYGIEGNPLGEVHPSSLAATDAVIAAGRS